MHGALDGTRRHLQQLFTQLSPQISTLLTALVCTTTTQCSVTSADDDPESTTFTQGTKTYTATASETLTITDCPCTYTTALLPTGSTSSSVHVAPSSVPVYNATSVPPVWITTTETVATYTTYCPSATTVVQGSYIILLNAACL